MRLCEIVRCGKPHKARGMCKHHYWQWQRTDTAFLARMKKWRQTYLAPSRSGPRARPDSDRRYWKQQAAEATTRYILRLNRQLRGMPAEHVEAYRQLILLKRELRK